MKKISGPTLQKPYYDFVEGESKARSMTKDQLEYAIRDALEAAKAMSGGHNDTAENWYRDEVSTMRKELNRRELPVKANFKAIIKRRAYNAAEISRFEEQVNRLNVEVIRKQGEYERLLSEYNRAKNTLEELKGNLSFSHDPRD